MAALSTNMDTTRLLEVWERIHADTLRRVSGPRQFIEGNGKRAPLSREGDFRFLAEAERQITDLMEAGRG